MSIGGAGGCLLQLPVDLDVGAEEEGCICLMCPAMVGDQSALCGGCGGCEDVVVEPGLSRHARQAIGGQRWHTVMMMGFLPLQLSRGSIVLAGDGQPVDGGCL